MCGSSNCSKKKPTERLILRSSSHKVDQNLLGHPQGKSVSPAHQRSGPCVRTFHRCDAQNLKFECPHKIFVPVSLRPLSHSSISLLELLITTVIIVIVIINH